MILKSREQYIGGKINRSYFLKEKINKTDKNLTYTHAIKKEKN